MAIPYALRASSGIYHFRLRIPRNYHHLGTEIRLSLSTRDKHQAAILAASLRIKAFDLLPTVGSINELKASLSDRPQARSRPAIPVPQSLTLRTLWDRYAAHQLHDARNKTRHESSHALDVLIELSGGDLPSSEFTKARVRDFVAALASYPSRRSLGKMASMTLAQIQSGEYQPISIRTQSNIITLLSAFANWLTAHGYIDANPLAGIRPKAQKQVAKQKTWSHADIALWFSLEHLDTLQGWQYWLPLMGIYTGARLEELAALDAADVHEHEGIYYFEIHDRDGRHIKNASSNRLVPIHSRLIELGFREFVDSRKDQERLFDLRRIQGRYGFNVSKWFGRERKKLGISPDFHGLRHTAAESLRLADVQGHTISWLLGHSGATMTDHYGRDGNPLHRLPLVHEAVEKLIF
ncbi:tyrosine-type recombinase/integrase [Cobetia crustatorum]|uniref:Tyrosine-type recombinase/integrase n=1 Tax=Cobetia crustatorum TaxID=553385 RepID=A0A558HXI4_9GAMM|nr:tyrosine-type recombinase/integrase [Cobetia crustatorum]TVU73842.1 tyrosine-type recombinase/integrase [Cobetia crustatorum]